MLIRKWKPGFAILCTGLFLFSCTKQPEAPATPLSPEAAAAQKAWERGKQVYQVNCTACHNSNPKLNGPVGPDVFGSSLELLQARIMSISYPPGYKPKRETHSMAPLPHLKDDIPAIHTYLNR